MNNPETRTTLDKKTFNEDKQNNTHQSAFFDTIKNNNHCFMRFLQEINTIATKVDTNLSKYEVRCLNGSCIPIRDQFIFRLEGVISLV